MHKFYKNAGLLLLLLLFVSGLFITLGYSLTKHQDSMLPRKNSTISWFPSVSLLGEEQSTSLTILNDGQDAKHINYNFFLPKELMNPYASFIFYLSKPQTTEDLVDLSGYTGIKLDVNCEPNNILILALYTYAQDVTVLDKPETYRVNLSFFQCSKEKKSLFIPFSELDAADWWIDRYGLEFTDREPDLSKVHGFAINNSLQSPRDKLSTVNIQNISLAYNKFYFLYGSILVVLLLWFFAAFKMIRFYIQERVLAAEAKVRMDRPLVAYQKITIQREETDLKSRLLKHIAIHYTQPDFNIEEVANTLHTTRNRINEILKEELQLTFTGYINKLRLTEAARLLSENPELSIMRIAFEVGYNNVTYFNTKFKKEYGCTPNMFRSQKKPPNHSP